MARKRKQVVLGLPKNTRQRDGSGVARRDHSALIISVCQQPSKSFVELPTCFQPEEAEEEFHRSCLRPSNPYAEPCEKRLTFHSKCVTHRTGHLRSTWPLSQVQVGPCDLGESRADQMSTGESSSQRAGKFIDWTGFANYIQDRLEWNTEFLVSYHLDVNEEKWREPRKPYPHARCAYSEDWRFSGLTLVKIRCAGVGLKPHGARSCTNSIKGSDCCKAGHSKERGWC